MKHKKIPFNWPYMTGKELNNISDARLKGCLSGDGPYTQYCHKWLESQTGCNKALLTHSCTGALEMAALLLDIKPGDEIIMPSYTFVSTANAFVLRGGVPVFVDIRQDTLNINEYLIEAAITSRTRAIVAVHYAGVACEMDVIISVAKANGLRVIEDAAQGIMARYKGKPLGSIGDIGTYSFHETKNVTSGEGGALLLNDPNLVLKAEIIREKGTDRSSFDRGEINKYTWQEIGSSYLPGELVAAFLRAQLEEAEKITQNRMVSWQLYHKNLLPLEKKGIIRRPIVPEGCQHNAHMYYILLATRINRQLVLDEFRKNNIWSVFHYVPLHSSPAGRKYGRVNGSLKITNKQAKCLVRLPLWTGINERQISRVVDVLTNAVNVASING